MAAYVVVSVASGIELFAAEVAAVGFGASVDAHVDV
jgi:hypothetical protein